MKFEGQHSVNGSTQFVWSLLHDPAIICSTLTDCEACEQIGPKDYAVTWLVQHGPLEGRYVGQLRINDDTIYERFSLHFLAEGSEGRFRGQGTVYLSQEGDATLIEYEGDLELLELSERTSPRLVRTLANAIIRRCFEAVTKQVQIQTGIHTTQLLHEEPVPRRTGAVTLQDALAEIRQDRRTIWVVLTLLALAFFTLSGVVLILLLLLRWGKRSYDRRVAEAVRDQQIAGSSFSRV